MKKTGRKSTLYYYYKIKLSLIISYGLEIEIIEMAKLEKEVLIHSLIVRHEHCEEMTRKTLITL